MTEQTDNTDYKAVAIALKDRIGSMVSQYETDMALLRAEATGLVSSLQTENERLTEENERLNGLVPKEKTK